MNLSHLRYLIALSEHQSFRKAADALFITQSALSRSILALEEELGVKLVDRHGHKNSLTSYGQHAVAVARRVVGEASELRRGIDLMLDGQLGSLSVGYGSGPAAVLEAGFCRYMATKYPRVVVKNARGATELLLRSLRAEQLDTLVVDRRLLANSDDLKIDPLPPLRGGFICRAGHPLLASAPVDFEALSAYPVASTPLSPEIGRSLTEGFGSNAHPDKLITIVSQDVNTLLDVIETTDALFFGIFAGARERLAAGRLCELKTTFPGNLYGEFAVVVLARRAPPNTFRLFRSFVDEQFQDQHTW